MQAAIAALKAFNPVFSPGQILYRLKYYLLSIGFVWSIILFYYKSPYYKQFLNSASRQALVVLALTYTFLSLIYYIGCSKQQFENSRAVIALRGGARFIGDSIKYLNNFTRRRDYPAPRLAEIERVSILFMVVKIIFLPMMIVFTVGGYHTFVQLAANHNNFVPLLSVYGFNHILYPAIFTLFLLIDTAVFAFGYAFEASWLRNKVRSVEPTALGWLVALVCYQPFGLALTRLVNSPANDYAHFPHETSTFIMRVGILLLMSVYVLATIALGTKASNLTNRGIVSWGPYHLIRHPAYTAKNLAWWLTILPVFSIGAVLGMATWSFVYFLRAITEERHLIRDPDYQAYCKKVRYRFIPGII